MTPIGFTTKLDAVVHIGAGACLEIDDHRATGAKRIILVEANPVAAAELRGRFAGDSRVEVFEKAVAGKAGERQLHIFNLASANSLRNPTGLKDLFPALQAEEELPMSAVAADAFLGGLGFFNEGKIGLFLEAGGEELSILECMDSAGQLTNYEEVVVSTGRSPLYEGAPETETVHKLLEDKAYIVNISSEDPDRPIISARLTPLYKDKQKLERDIKELKERLQQAAYRKERFDAELAKAEAQFELIRDLIVRDKSA